MAKRFINKTDYAEDIEEKSGNYTKPELRERIKQRILNSSRGGKPGQWSARKAQLVAIEYRKAGGGYRGKRKKAQRSLQKWTREEWTTSDGKPAIRSGGTRRYLPKAAWAKLTPGQIRATNRKKMQASRDGEQFVANTRAAESAGRRARKSKTENSFVEIKALRFRKIGNRFERFDPDAIDGDGDGIVQEGTNFQRPATARRLTGRMAGNRFDSSDPASPDYEESKMLKDIAWEIQQNPSMLELSPEKTPTALARIAGAVMDLFNFRRLRHVEPVGHYDEEEVNRVTRSMRIEMADDGIAMLIADPPSDMRDLIPTNHDYSNVRVPSIQERIQIYKNLLDAELKPAKDGQNINNLAEMSVAEKWFNDNLRPLITSTPREVRDKLVADGKLTALGSSLQFDELVERHMRVPSLENFIDAGFMEFAQYFHDVLGHIGTGRGFDRHGEFANFLALVELFEKLHTGEQKDYSAFFWLRRVLLRQLETWEQADLERGVPGSEEAVALLKRVIDRIGASDSYIGQEDMRRIFSLDNPKTYAPRKPETKEMKKEDIKKRSLAYLHSLIDNGWPNTTRVHDSFGLGKTNKATLDSKSLRGIGRRFERFDPNAFDGDGDGIIQEGTNFQRPATANRLSGAMGRTVTPYMKERNARIIKRYLDGATLEEIAKEENSTRKAVTWVLNQARKRGEVPKQTRLRPPQPERNAEIVRQYNEGATLGSLAEKYNITKTGIGHVLKAAAARGETTFPKNPKQPKEQKPNVDVVPDEDLNILDMYDSGMRVNDIAQRLNITSGSVLKILAKNRLADESGRFTLPKKQKKDAQFGLMSKSMKRSRIGARLERFDPNAIDGDGDGLVQEGSTFERPATPSTPKRTIIQPGTAPTPSEIQKPSYKINTEDYPGLLSGRMANNNKNAGADVKFKITATSMPNTNNARLVIKYGSEEIVVDFDPRYSTWTDAYEHWNTWRGNFEMRVASHVLMGMGSPQAYGMDEDAPGIAELHEFLTTGKGKIPEYMRIRLNNAIKHAIAGLMFVDSHGEVSQHPLYRGLNDVALTDELSSARVGDTISWGLSATSPDLDTAVQFAMNFETDAVVSGTQGNIVPNNLIIEIEPGSRVVPAAGDQHLMEFFRDGKPVIDVVEYLTQGRFEVVDKKSVPVQIGANTVMIPRIKIRQISTFNPVTGKYTKPSKLSGRMASSFESIPDAKDRKAAAHKLLAEIREEVRTRIPKTVDELEEAVLKTSKYGLMAAKFRSGIMKMIKPGQAIDDATGLPMDENALIRSAEALAETTTISNLREVITERGIDLDPRKLQELENMISLALLNNPHLYKLSQRYGLPVFYIGKKVKIVDDKGNIGLVEVDMAATKAKSYPAATTHTATSTISFNAASTDFTTPEDGSFDLTNYRISGPDVSQIIHMTDGKPSMVETVNNQKVEMVNGVPQMQQVAGGSTPSLVQHELFHHFAAMRVASLTEMIRNKTIDDPSYIGSEENKTDEALLMMVNSIVIGEDWGAGVISAVLDSLGINREYIAQNAVSLYATVKPAEWFAETMYALTGNSGGLDKRVGIKERALLSAIFPELQSVIMGDAGSPESPIPNASKEEISQMSARAAQKLSGKMYQPFEKITSKEQRIAAAKERHNAIKAVVRPTIPRDTEEAQRIIVDRALRQDLISQIRIAQAREAARNNSQYAIEDGTMLPGEEAERYLTIEATDKAEIFAQAWIEEHKPTFEPEILQQVEEMATLMYMLSPELYETALEYGLPGFMVATTINRARYEKGPNASPEIVPVRQARDSSRLPAAAHATRLGSIILYPNSNDFISEARRREMTGVENGSFYSYPIDEFLEFTQGRPSRLSEILTERFLYTGGGEKWTVSATPESLLRHELIHHIHSGALAQAKLNYARAKRDNPEMEPELLLRKMGLEGFAAPSWEDKNLIEFLKTLGLTLNDLAASGVSGYSKLNPNEFLSESITALFNPYPKMAEEIGPKTRALIAFLFPTLSRVAIGTVPNTYSPKAI